MKNSFIFVGLFLLLLLLVPLVTARLQIGFYNSTCPQAELIVGKVIQQRFKTDRTITAAFLRMHFHDCFVRGCDASVLIDPTKTTPSEKDAVPNQTVRGFNIIDEIKKKLEAACPGIVSCADIITLATRESVALAGGPNYAVPTGRRDGLISDPNLVNVPGPTFSVAEALQSFTAKGLTLNDMVTLLGAHTVGVAHCDFFQDRLSDFQGTGKPDPTMDPALVSKLFNLCGTQSRPFKEDPTAFLDQSTPFVVDNQYYNDILSRRGIMQIDQELALDKSSASIVSRFANNALGFQQRFADALEPELIQKEQAHEASGPTGALRKVRRPKEKNEEAHMKNSSAFLCLLLLLPLVTAQLEVGFYNKKCPRAEQIVRSVIVKQFGIDKTITAAFLRMHFHDCMVRGCDASVLIDPTSTAPSEKDAVPNQTLRGFDIVDKAKKKLEAQCPGIVSCADIIALATRDSVFLSGGLNYSVPTGRRDGLISNPNLVNLPGPAISVSQALQFFVSKGLNLSDLVILLGAHTVGVAHCGFFQDRLFDFQGTSKRDPTMNRALWLKLFGICGTQVLPLLEEPTAFLDQTTPFTIDNKYYRDIRKRRGILQIDQELVFRNSTASLVSAFANDPDGFQQSFANALVKMGRCQQLSPILSTSMYGVVTN
ncbi:hypothetical protein RHMOL_Rhmol03G0053700 [Rhododendron molle]|uniref:Uncharacterized protein n=1 Tax=Rhododendron molle TaxID=49168 RepID=A0ACC0PC14_RHOML|nr:hypothetical protein RHMOL_Rhmol03G0053700 [Rhododendron molle]